MEDLKYWQNKEPICPKCDQEIDISGNELYELYEEEEHHISCPYCDTEIIVESTARWVFTTSIDEEES